MMTLREVNIPISMHVSIYSRTIKEFMTNEFRGKSNKMALTQGFSYAFALSL